MSIEQTTSTVQIGKFYTAARKFKQLIGQLPDGSIIPGGPYTLTQFVPTLIMLVPYALKVWFFGWSSVVAAIIEIAFVLSTCTISIFVLGQLPPTRRSVFHLTSTTPALFTSSSNGYWRGKPIKGIKTHKPDPQPPSQEIAEEPTPIPIKPQPSKSRPASGFTRFQNSLNR